MTTANKITIFRILLVPFFVVQMLYYIRTGDELNRTLALVAFALAALSDGLDGFIARRYGQKSELGAILDPLADKLLLVSAIILLTNTNERFAQIPLWLTVTILSRDLILLLGLAIVHYTVGKTEVRPNIMGKLSTVFQMGLVLWILFRWDERALPILIWGAGFFVIGSAALYILHGVRKLSASPSSAATKNQ